MEVYNAPKWSLGRHGQSILPSLVPWPCMSYERERWNTPDGDFVDVDWAGRREARRLLVLFHGLEGHSRSHYARRLGARAIAKGWRFAVAHFRGCSKRGFMAEPNLLARTYHSGSSDEVDWMLRKFSRDHGYVVYAVGVSLGGNALLRWLGEQGAAAAELVHCAAAVSAPFDLAASGNTLARFPGNIYGRFFLPGLKRKSLDKLKDWPGAYDAHGVRAAGTLREFEDAVTAPLHGFDNVIDYWTRASALPLLAQIRVPTLVLNARNDPFLPDFVLRNLQRFGTLPANVKLETQDEGGHAGFPGHNHWLARRILRWLKGPRPAQVAN